MGALSAWGVWSALGMYPAVPGLPIFTLVNPVFSEVEIDKGGAAGGVLTITSPDVDYTVDIGTAAGRRYQYVADIELKHGSGEFQQHGKSFVSYRDLFTPQKLSQDVHLRIDVATEAEETDGDVGEARTTAPAGAVTTLEKGPSISTKGELDSFIREKILGGEYDPEVTVSFGGAVYEVAEGSVAVIPVRLSGDPERVVEVALKRMGLGGLAEEDYAAIPASVVFAAGETRKEITFTAIDDRQDDDGEALVLSFRSLPDRVSGSGEATVSIVDDDTAGVTIAPTTLTLREGSSDTYTVKLDSQPSASAMVMVTAPLGTDVSTDRRSLRFTRTTWNVAQTVNVTAATDADAVADDEVTISHSVSGGGYGSVSVEDVEVTVTEIDTVGVTLTPATLTLREDSTDSYTVVLSTQPTDDVTVAIMAPAGTDVSVDKASLTFGTNTWYVAQTVAVTAADDADAESDADVGGGETLAVTGVIHDNDMPEVEVSFGSDSYEVTEGETVRIALSLSADPERQVVVRLVPTYRGGASHADHSDLPASVTFESGETGRELSFAATEDGADDDGEAVVLSFGPLPPRVSGSGETTLAIRDNDDGGTSPSGPDPEPPPPPPPPPPSRPPPPPGPRPPTVSVAAAEASESSGAVVFEVRLSATSSSTVAVDYATADAAGAAGARAGSDYTATRGTLAFPARSTAVGRILVPVTDDRVYEPESETFTLTLRNPTNATLAGGGSVLQVVGTIHDDDDGPPMASFEVSGAACDAELCRAVTGESVRFRDSSLGRALFRRWEFGDGESSRSRRPDHAWLEPGFYEVTLTVGDGSRVSTTSRRFLVEARDPAGACAPDAETLCLQDSRYAVAVEWRKADGESGAGSVVHAGTNDSGLFTFFNLENWEILIKVLDGCALNGHVWVYGASTTDLGYSIRVTDTVTGVVPVGAFRCARCVGKAPGPLGFEGAKRSLDG